MKKLYKQVLKQIKKYQTIVVVRHDSPDFDASGSQFGLVTWIKDNFPDKKVYACGKPHKFFSPKLYPTTDENIELNDKYLLIIVDVANQPRIDGKEYIDNADYIIKIDHHPLCDDFGNISIVDEHAAAAAEIIGEMLISYKMKISEKCAYYLYSAIVGDSGRFQYSDTSSRTFNVVSKLFETNFDFQEIYDKMYIKSIKDIENIKYLYNVVNISENGVAYYIIDDATLNQLKIEREQMKAYVNLFAGYEEIKIWIQATEDTTAEDEYKWRVSIRSRGIKINDIASKYNGGGHDNASGCKCKNKEEILQMVSEYNDLLK